MHSKPSLAHMVAVATPCCPAPVSAMMRGFPIFFARMACPIALLILCAPVCARSSLLSQMVAPPHISVSRSALCSGVGPPTKSRRYSSSSARKAGSSLIFSYSSSISLNASESVSGMNCPPNLPNRLLMLSLAISSATPSSGLRPRIVAWFDALFPCLHPALSSDTIFLTAVTRSAVVLPAFCTALRMALPTTTPSPMLATLWTILGVEMPKPTARGRSVWDRTRAMNSPRSDGSSALAPVTPVVETQ
mmetsp:Transcript_13628/g.32994  ORF Transcript_13628/g.32994 Transcript_13628/m.32994 type:complete len:248 (-) Transcript_13628:604-1347(-)